MIYLLVLRQYRGQISRAEGRGGIPERVAMQMTGHKTHSVFERYNIVSSGDLVEAAKKLHEVRRLGIAAEDKGQLVKENCSSMLSAK